jgi:GT2 family glycosyltransferase
MTPDTVASSFPDVRVIPLFRNLGASARNIGVAEARTPYVAFNDDDSWWADGALSAAGDALDLNPSLGLIAAHVLVGTEERLDPTCARMAAGTVDESLPGRPVSGFLACGAVVRRVAFTDAGGFHPRYGIGGEERLLTLNLLRRRWRLAYVPEIVCFHHPSPRADRSGRIALVARNDIWTTWLRHRPGRMFEETLTICKLALCSSRHRRVLMQAVVGIPWVLAERQPLSQEDERYVLALDRAGALACL